MSLSKMSTAFVPGMAQPPLVARGYSAVLRGAAPPLRGGVDEKDSVLGSLPTAMAAILAPAAVAAGIARRSSRRHHRATALQVVGTGVTNKEGTEIKYYELDSVKAPVILQEAREAVRAAAGIAGKVSDAEQGLSALLCDAKVQSFFFMVSRLPVFSKEMGRAFCDDLELLKALKQLKYFWNLPQSHLVIQLEALAQQLEGPEAKKALADFRGVITAADTHTSAIKDFALPAEVRQAYMKNADYLEEADPHAVYPTSIYRQCDALTLATQDASTIEAVTSTTITTTIKIARNVLDPSNHLLYDVYKPLGRCVAVVDDKVEEHYGKELEAYFETHGIEYVKLVYSGNEVDKDIRDVERILVDLKRAGQGRQEPVLVVGGGVIADIAGFATALYSRNTPYVMLCTSIVSGIDAGPSPRVCCNGFDYKNLYGAYHPPVLTITDRGFWRTLHPGWLRHGVAEIIKMAVMTDLSLFELMEAWGPRVVHTNFGTLGDQDDPFFQDVCDRIVGKAMEDYVRAEYGNLWETHQCRPHAYGHTWSPGYELPSGMLHGQAVGTCMGFGAYLSWKEGWVTEEECHRILKVISNCELALYHPIMDDSRAVWQSQVALIEKRGGNLCAPIPKPLGESGYLNNLSEAMLDQRMQEYKEICLRYPREGRGVDDLCVDVGLEDPQAKKTKKQAAKRFVVTPSDLAAVKLESASAQIEEREARSALAEALRVVDGVDAMVAKYTAQPSQELKTISVETAKTNPMWAEAAEQEATSRLMEAEMISGQAEGQLLQMLVRLSSAKRALDIGTFTGYSSLALAEALPEEGSVITLEREAEAAKMAEQNWAKSAHRGKIHSRVGEADGLLEQLVAEGQSFDLVFLDVDKPGYKALYEKLMETNLLKVGGLLVVDNTMYKGEELSGHTLSVNGKGAQAFNKAVLEDDRVHQVMLPLRDGVTLVHRLR